MRLIYFERAHLCVGFGIGCEPDVSVLRHFVVFLFYATGAPIPLSRCNSIG